MSFAAAGHRFLARVGAPAWGPSGRASALRARRSARHSPAPWQTWSTWLALLLSVAVSLAVWAAADRPAAMPDFAGRIGGLAFSPFHRGQSPEDQAFPSAAEMRSDLVLAARLTGRIRVYTVQGDFAAIPELARDLPLRITLGAWLDRDIVADRAEVARLVGIARGHANVERVLIGNEALYRGDVSIAQMLGFIAQARAGLRLPVSTAEPYDVWLKHPELARAVDFITVHLLPYWEGVPNDQALGFAMDRLAEVARAYPDKRIVIGEIGWPSKGVDRGAARASRVAQATFLRSFFSLAQTRHLDYFVMEAFDQPWKTSFEGRAAGYWGMMDLDRQAKWPMTGPVTEVPDWPHWAVPSALTAAGLAGLLLGRRPDIRFRGKLLLAMLLQGFAAALTLVLLAMASTYLSRTAGLVWAALATGQLLLFVLLMADSFELAETLWAGVWRRVPLSCPAPPGLHLPKVSIHVPICNEPPLLVRQTLDALADLDYPDFEVLVVDNNTSDPALWEPVADHCARLGARFRFFHLGAWPGFKAGALNFALRETAADAEIVGVLDSDYVVAPDWLRCMVPHFARSEVGFAQSPQDYRDNDGSAFKRMMFWEYAGFFRIGMVARNERNAIIQHGTMTLIRKRALEGAGAWGEWCICEDAELGVRLFRDGWEAVYGQRSFGRGVMPDDFAGYRKQRARWAYGAMRICRAHWAALLSPTRHDLSLGQRWHFLVGWLPWLGDALGLGFLVMGLAWSVLLVAEPARFEFPIVLFMLPSIGLFGFKLAQILALYHSRVGCRLVDRIGAAVAGLALSHTIAKAVWRGLTTRGAPFHRTPKLCAAPAVVQGLVMAREELALLALTWTALAAVAIAHRLATWEARLWCLVLLTQSLPYLASVAVSLLAARRAPARARLASDRAVTGALASAAGGDD